MALSNWHTLALEFDIAEYIGKPEDAPPVGRVLRERIDEALNASAGEDTCNGIAAEGIMNQDSFQRLVIAEREARTAREGRFYYSEGSWRSPTSDVEVAFYKNLVQIRSEGMWLPDAGFERPTIASLTGNAKMKIGGITVCTLNAPQEGIALCAWAEMNGTHKGKMYTRYTGLLGLGVLGYSKHGRLVGVTEEAIFWLREQIGVGFPLFLRVLDLSGAEHFNQGDAVISQAFGIEVPRHKPGKAEMPMIFNALQGFVFTFDDEDGIL